MHILDVLYVYLMRVHKRRIERTNQPKISQTNRKVKVQTCFSRWSGFRSLRSRTRRRRRRRRCCRRCCARAMREWWADQRQGEDALWGDNIVNVLIIPCSNVVARARSSTASSLRQSRVVDVIGRANLAQVYGLQSCIYYMRSANATQIYQAHIPHHTTHTQARRAYKNRE